MLLLLLSLGVCAQSAQAAVPLGAFGFEDDDGGCISEGETAQWAWGAITGGPGGGFQGENGWALNLAGGYLNDTADTLTCGGIDISGAVRPVLSFSQWFDLDVGDAGSVAIDDGSGWQTVTPIYGASSTWSGASDGWEQAAVDLSGFGSPLSVRWQFAADASGIGAGWYVDEVGWWDGDAVPPDIRDVDVLGDTEDVNIDRTVTALVRDDLALTSVMLRYSVDSGADVDVPMVADGDTWSADLPGERADTSVTYSVVAGDAENQTASDPFTFRYYLAAPRNLRLDAERAVGHTVPLVWDVPGSSHTVIGYKLYRNSTLVAQVASNKVDAPVTGGLDAFTVTATYSDGQGDPSEPLEVTAGIPEVTGLSPSEGWPGDHIRLSLTGEYLLLTDGQVTVSLGDGITVEPDVRDVDTAVLDVQIDASAIPGVRDLTVESPTGETAALASFEVLDGADRPRLIPQDFAVSQGQATTLSIDYVGEMATSSPSVDLGEDVVVDAVAAANGSLTLLCTVSGSAPVGERPVVVDDGVRLFDGVTLTVRNASVQGTGCTTGAGEGMLAVAIAALLVRRRRYSSNR